jgi:hypothetical protein
MPATFSEVGSAALGAFARAAGLAALVLAALVAFMFAAATVVVIGLMVAGAAIALRFAPNVVGAREDGVLEARRTPAGWVVETAAKRKP